MKRALYSDKDLEEFKKSIICHDIMEFISKCAESVKGKTISSVNITDDNIPLGLRNYVNFMNSLYSVVDEYPPLKQPMRFGNKAFKQFHQRVCKDSLTFSINLLTDYITNTDPNDSVLKNSDYIISTDNINDYAEELSTYVNGSFGNEIRIDYGTGHELNMFLFYLCLYKLNVIKNEDLSAVILLGFSSYIRVMRRLQVEYKLEPAGSHGVWGLDDYHCLTFLFGAAQLCANAEVNPSSVNSMDILKEYKNENFYMEGIYFIRTIKSSAPFSETSPMLYDISGIGEWSRVAMTLLKVFQGEVLFKLPAMQHVIFGKLLKCTWTPSEDHTQSFLNNHDIHTINNDKLSNSFIIRPGSTSIGSTSIMKPSVGK
mmetsp:Transcript_25291/g.23013  ORF Transcript_25291/g.23013 Transcript_25291/m.23013 type:complete len:371 (+) Transcript_25291:68-1180(+)